MILQLKAALWVKTVYDNEYATTYSATSFMIHVPVFGLPNDAVVCMSSPYAGGVQVGSLEPPFKINDIHSMHVVEVLVYTHLLALVHIHYETEIDIVKCFYRSILEGWRTQVYCFCNFSLYI